MCCAKLGMTDNTTRSLIRPWLKKLTQTCCAKLEIGIVMPVCRINYSAMVEKFDPNAEIKVVMPA